MSKGQEGLRSVPIVEYLASDLCSTVWCGNAPALSGRHHVPQLLWDPERKRRKTTQRLIADRKRQRNASQAVELHGRRASPQSRFRKRQPLSMNGHGRSMENV